MNYRHATFILLLFALLIPTGARAQSESMLGAAAPQLVCTVTLSADSLFYVSNDYVPNTVRVTVRVTNTGDQGVGNIMANLVKSPRFVIGGDGQIPKFVTPDSLGPNESGEATFDLIIAFAPQSNVRDTVLVTITSNRGYTTCSKTMWIQREVRANIDCTSITKYFKDNIFLDEFKFNDSTNSYYPDTLQLKLVYTNIGQDVLHEGVITRILNPGLSADTTDPSKFVGPIAMSQTGDVTFGVVPKNRDNDTTTTVCFQIQGRTGYKDYQTGEIPLWADTCCVDIFIPKSRQPKYEVECRINVDSVLWYDHKYNPATFTFEIRVKNTGTADGIRPMATPQLPNGVSAVDGSPKLVEEVLPVGVTSKWVSWEFRPQPLPTMETKDICVTVIDEYGYTGSACCSVVIDSIRKAQFSVICESDVLEVIVDTVIGEYVNGTFDVRLIVSNTGTDYADSVVASLSIQSPDIKIVDGVNRKPLWLEDGHTLTTLEPGEREDTLTQRSSWVFTWTVEALPRGVAGDISMTFTVTSVIPGNGGPDQNIEQTCEVVIFVPRLDPPDIVQTCYTNPGYDPPDTLHISSVTGGYDPERITFCTKIWNEGGGTAKNVVASFSPPENMILAPGEFNAKPVIPAGRSVNDVGPHDTVIICWEVIPLPRFDHGKWIEFRSDITSTSQIGIAPCVTGVFVPKRPVTAALSISRDNVTYFGADQVFVPVYIDNSDGKDLRSIDMHFKFNVDGNGNPLPNILLEFLIARPGPLFPTNWTMDRKAQLAPGLDDQHNGRVKMVGSTALDGYGLLLYLVFKPIFGAAPNHLDWFVSEIPWPATSDVEELVKINDGLIQPILQPGQVVISGDCLRPVNATENYIIAQNRPNPFNPATTIDYFVPQTSHIRIEVLDVLGRTVQTLVNGTVSEGNHSVVFNADGLTSGMYFYRMTAPGYTQIKKMMVSK